MKKLLRRSGVVGMGLTWAAGWVFAGGLFEAASNVLPPLPLESLVDIWPMELAIPGLLGGVVFAAMLWIAERRRLDEPSPARFGAWGAVAGLLMGILAVAAGVASDEYPALWPRAGVIVGIATLLGAVSGAGAALVFRYVNRDR